MIRIIWMLVLLAVLQGCAVTRVGDNLPYGILNNDDLALVEAGLPTYLLINDGLIENWPQRVSLLTTGAGLYSAYAGLFVSDPERASRMSEKALAYALRATCAQHRRYCDVREQSLRELETVLASARGRDVGVLYTLGTVWAGYVDVHSNDWNAVGELAKVRSIIEAAITLDETYQFGQAHMYLGVLDSILPEALGGNPDQAREHFERAIALSQGKNLMASVLLAERYHRMMFDRAAHDQVLKDVLAADPNMHGLTLQNTFAQDQAKVLLDSADDFF